MKTTFAVQTDTDDGVDVAAVSRRAQAQAAKRRQILDAAQTVFKRLGYDGASMNDIAAEARVSKPTLYVYFDNKESLFAALIDDLKSGQPERIFATLDPDNPDVRAVLVAFGLELMRKLTRPDHMALIRLVTGAAEKFPAIGRMLFDAGPRRGIETVGAYLEEQARRGRLRVPDKEIAACQLLDLVQSKYFRQLLFHVIQQPTEQELAYTVRLGVEVFMAAYGVDQKPGEGRGSA
jgi:AcrR family transcriptional regulator